MNTYARIVDSEVLDVQIVSEKYEINQRYPASQIDAWGGLESFVSVPSGTLAGAKSDGQGGYNNPINTTPEPFTKIISVLEYKRRLTALERITIRASIDPVVIDFMDLLNSAEQIDLNDADTIAGTNYLESSGLINEGRANEVLGV